MVFGLKLREFEGKAKDEVSFGAIVYNQIMRCLDSSRGRSVAGKYCWITYYDVYENDVNHLVSLVSVIADDEFLNEISAIEREYSKVWKKIDEDMYYGRWHSPDDEEIAEVERIIYRFSFQKFNACLRLLKRKGVIVEKLLEGKL